LLAALALSLSLMLLVAGGVADRGGLFPLVLLSGSAVAVGVLMAIFPHGPQFLLGTTNGIAMYACLFVVIGRAGFPDAQDGAREIAFLLPIAGFVGACVWRRRELSGFAQNESAADLDHLPRFARWLGAIGVVGLVCLVTPMNRLSPFEQGLALIAAMAVIGAISVIAVADVVRLLVDVAVIFRTVTNRLGHLAVPIAAFSSIWALLVVAFGCAYRIADGLSATPLFHGPGGLIRINFSDALHFSVVTLASVGYGDIVPSDDGIRVLASMQMLCSQLLLLFGFYEIMRSSPAGGPDLNLFADARPPAEPPSPTVARRPADAEEPAGFGRNPGR